MLASKIGKSTLLPSMQLGLEDPGANSTNSGEGYSCIYTNTISWQSPTRPLPMEINPQVAFERMFGDGSSPELRKAHRDLDAAVDKLYNPRGFADDRSRVEHLFRLYEGLVMPTTAAVAANQRTNRRVARAQKAVSE